MIAILPDLVFGALEEMYESATYRQLEQNQIKKSMSDRSKFIINYFKIKTANVVAGEDVTMGNIPVSTASGEESKFYDFKTTTPL
jgi:hypothetical protein